MYSDIGYILSNYLLDYKIDIDSRICTIMSNELWLELVQIKDKEYVIFSNPYPIQSFCVNKNYLLTVFRCNEKSHIHILFERAKNKKRVIIRLSEVILKHNNCLDENELNYYKATYSLFGHSNNKCDKHDNLSLLFSESIQLTISINDLLESWADNKVGYYNTDWFIVTPSGGVVNNQIMRKEIFTALNRQYSYLKRGNMHDMNIFDKFTSKINKAFNIKNEIDKQKTIWANAFSTTKQSNREYYAKCFEYAQEYIGEDFSSLINSLKYSSEIWSDFRENISHINSKKAVLKYYNELSLSEVSICNELKKTITNYKNEI